MQLFTSGTIFLNANELLRRYVRPRRKGCIDLCHVCGAVKRKGRLGEEYRQNYQCEAFHLLFLYIYNFRVFTTMTVSQWPQAVIGIGHVVSVTRDMSGLCTR